jgi:hypothetical protein
MAAQFLGIPELFIPEDALGPDIAECSRELIMMGIPSNQTVVVNEYLELAFAQSGAVKMRQIVNCGTRGVHRRLIDQMDLTEKSRVAGDGAIQSLQVFEKRHPRRAMPLCDLFYCDREFVDCIRGRLAAVPQRDVGWRAHVRDSKFIN